jgi:hypothetical protein
LDEVEEIVRGDRARPQPLTPAVFVYTEAARNDPTPRSLHETWTLPVILVAVVKDSDPESGYRKATELAAKARSIVLKGSRIDLDYVQDIRSSRFEASAPWLKEGQLFYSLAVVDVIFTILEN